MSQTLFTATSRGKFSGGGLTSPCAVDKGGLVGAHLKREGDGATPAGVHQIDGLMYRPDRIAASALPGWAVPIGPGDLWTAGLIGAAVCLILGLKWRDFLLHAFDPAQAQASGLRTHWLHYGLLAILSLTVVATLSAVGLILAVALLVTPGAIAFLLSRSFGQMLIVAVAVCLTAMLTGIYASFWIDAAPAPTIVLVLTAMFIAAFTRRMALTLLVARHGQTDLSTQDSDRANLANCATQRRLSTL